MDAEKGLEKVAIIGSGPAAYTAAIYTSRANLSPLLIEGEVNQAKRTEVPGGQLMITTDVENYPGFPEGVEGPELMELMKKQAARFGTRFMTAWIESVDFSKRPFTLHAEGGEVIRARAVIVATGASAKWLNIPSEKALQPTGYVSACATCDGALPHFRNKHLAVVGGGDSAVEEATFLTRYASKVTMIHRRDQLRASKIMQDRAKANPKIAFQWNSTVTEVLDPSKKKVTGVRLKDTVNGKESTMECDGLFLAIGHEPATRPFKGHIALDEKGYVKVTRGTYTSVEGVFAAGDCVDFTYRQAITAAGQGCAAAIDAERWLEAQGH
ncbi:MAG TPA: thioredoxin-disulfide reductase [Planctomycetota bacterium]|nr:thioredoxin-disulfide reductase [Planctomycetota bacterium]